MKPSEIITKRRFELEPSKGTHENAQLARIYAIEDFLDALFEANPQLVIPKLNDND